MHRSISWLLGLTIASCGGDRPDPPVVTIRNAGQNLSRTIVAAHLRQEHVPGKNLLWCATIQLAWNELMEDVGGPVRLEGDPAAARVLNERLAAKTDLDEASYVARGGFEKDGIVASIHDELGRKFGVASNPVLLDGLPPLLAEDYLAFAYLLKNLAFETPLERGKHPLRFLGKTGVRSFGLGIDDDEGEGAWERWQERAKQIVVRDYGSESDFVLEILPKDRADRLLIARLDPGKTLLETVDSVLGRCAAGKGRRTDPLEGDEPVSVPSCDFEITSDFDDLTGKQFQNPRWEGYRISVARQRTRFRLDDKGAVLESEAVIVAPAAAPPEPRTPRRFICDGPFLILLMRRDAKRPYFALWVEDEELLIPEE